MTSFPFYIFATILILASLTVVGARHPLYNVLALVVAIFSLSCLFVQLEAYFVSMVLVLVYAGAVLVFFLFVVMCLNVQAAPMPDQSRFRLLGLLAGLFFIASLFFAIGSFVKAPAVHPSSIRGTIENVGKILFTDFLLPFELTSLLLLIAVFGIVALAKGALGTGQEETDS